MKAFFILSMVLLGSITITQAQLDTTENPIKQDDPALRQSSKEIQQSILHDMVKISANELPAALKKTLEQADYKGQNRTFYKNKKKKEYAVEIQHGEITSFYLFDKDGKPINSQ